MLPPHFVKLKKYSSGLLHHRVPGIFMLYKTIRLWKKKDYNWYNIDSIFTCEIKGAFIAPALKL